ncbi:MAG: DNA-directed RNA polymerase subunit omega [Planctomycetia bacterium]|jgi:DNA-directed RNA polymerase subunit omega|nr:DNA-directed RNA polymerase subunit omega [Planctomycetia bacterium]MCC7313835.1 DNA-directed RNA polymerase subunit omega [Planctomycetota bacterium]OQZ06533.1 MAG: DNA-directed RNA polymerase subunit omega [Planctomycetes bacterium UTPLA1]
MIYDLKNEDLVNRVGGRFKLAALIQRRMRELMMGARPLVEPGKMTPMEIVVKEIIDGKIEANMDGNRHDVGSNA